MRRCPQCGFPRRLSKFLEWHSDGTVIGSVRPRIPVMFLEVDEWDTIYDELALTIGSPIEHIVVEAQKHIGMDLYDMVKALYWNINAKRLPNSRLLRPQWLGKLIIWAMGNDLAAMGAGRASLESYRPGDHLTLRFTNPCLHLMVVGNCQGIYESVEQMAGSRAGFKWDGDELVVFLTPAEEKPVSEDRLYLEEAVGGKGPLDYERCTRCGVPLKAAKRLVWEIERGEILNPETGKRDDMMAVQSLNAILRELERELGDEVINIVCGAQKRYSASRLQEDQPPADGFWDDYLARMALRGLGYPEKFEDSGKTVSVVIKNAYNQDLYASKIAAGLEFVSGGSADIEWASRERDHGEYKITAG
ncbi:MAG: hypothetical protein ACYC99_12915 [Candidatus Geothermincolia bacterium]